MIHKLVLKNFKKVKEESFIFNNFDLIVGANNSGKSTALQALAIWQFCVDQFRSNNKSGTNGIQVVLPNFTALPLPEFNLLWTDRTDREYKEDGSKPGKKSQIYIYIEIDVYWNNKDGEEKNFCVQIRYQSPQSIYAKPGEGWLKFIELDKTEALPKIIYVPPFSGLEPHERWMDDGNVRQNVGKAQPGSVLRNLLYRVIDRKDVEPKSNTNWKEICSCINNWFGVELMNPRYEKGVSTEIIVEYKSNKRTFDIISGGSGFHQILTLMAFLYGYPGVSTVLFDEPDAHLHVNLQRQIINYLKKHNDVQFLIATHSEEFIKSVEITSIISVLSGKPTRVESTSPVISALSLIDNIDILRTQDSPFILYIEGEDDERLLSAWAGVLGVTDVFQKFYPYILGGSSKKEMKEKADKHYAAMKQIVPDLNRALLFDYDNDEVALNPEPENLVLNEWKRKNIDNYLLVPDVWKRSALKELREPEGSLFITPYYETIELLFNEQNLNLPTNSSWKNVKAQIFKVIDGKKLLFESSDSLFAKLRSNEDKSLLLSRSILASNMYPEEIHEDIEKFFGNLAEIIRKVETKNS